MTYRWRCLESRIVDLVIGILLSLMVISALGLGVRKNRSSVYPCASLKATKGFDSFGAVYLTVVSVDLGHMDHPQVVSSNPIVP